MSILFFSALMLCPPRPPLFPYTTLFRSKILLTHSPQAMALYYGERALAGLRAVGDVKLHSGDMPLEGEALIDAAADRSVEHTSELQSPCNLVCRLLLEKKKRISCN